jgi:hypothetical protein
VEKYKVTGQQQLLLVPKMSLSATRYEVYPAQAALSEASCMLRVLRPAA